MAKIKHPSTVDIVNEIATASKNIGITHLSNNHEYWDGSTMALEGGKQVYNFGTCGYLGLETHPEIKDVSMDYLYN